MTKKYRELPAFETNEFKVGDNVHVYGCSSVKDGVLLKIRHIYSTAYMEARDSEDILHVVHFKQCRKLEEIKPRIFWAYELYHYNPNEDLDPCDTHSPRAIKVQEVL